MASQSNSPYRDEPRSFRPQFEVEHAPFSARLITKRQLQWLAWVQEGKSATFSQKWRDGLTSLAVTGVRWPSVMSAVDLPAARSVLNTNLSGKDCSLAGEDHLEDPSKR